MQHKNEEKIKKSYEKPGLRVIELAAEEVLSAGCKTGLADPTGIAGNGCLSGTCQSTPGS